MWRTTTVLLVLQASIHCLPSNSQHKSDDHILNALFDVSKKTQNLKPHDAKINNLVIDINTLNVFMDEKITPGDKAENKALDWWESTIFYQIYPRSFKDSDGDGIGDLNGVTSELQHLKDLGIGATWLSPIFKSPMYDFGYDIADFYEIQDEYGTMEDFENLLAKAAELDIKIVLDFVPNHGSNESEWFRKSLERDEHYKDYFIWEKGTVDENGNRQPPTNWVSVFRGSAWEYREERDEYYFHQFVVGQPDLNYRNPLVVEEMKNVLRFWLEKGIAGFRIDAINHLFEVDKAKFGGVLPDEPLTGALGLGPDDFGYVDHIYTLNQDETYDMVYQWREIFDEYNDENGFTRVILTEAYADIKQTMRYYGDGERLGSHMPFNFGLISDVNEGSSAQDVKYITDRWLTYMPLGQTANWVLGNHDQRRVASRYGAEKTDGLNMLLLSLPGVAITYMGEEIGMIDGYVSWEDTVDPQACNAETPEKGLTASRDPARTPYQWNSQKNAGFSDAPKTWLPVAANYETLNLELQKQAERSPYKVYKAISELRQTPTYKYGSYKSVAFNSDVFALVREYIGEPSYVVVWNFSGNNDSVDLTYFSGLTNQLEVVVTNTDSPKSVGDAVSTTLSLEPYEALILKTT